MKRANVVALMAMTCLGGITVPVAYATTYTGQVVGIQTQPSPTTSGNIRVSIQVTLNTGCGGFGGNWYVYDLPAGPAANMWGAILLAALNTERPVIITGCGTCDAWNIETITAIEAL